jgi:hypothetical protein
LQQLQQFLHLPPPHRRHCHVHERAIVLKKR